MRRIMRGHQTDRASYECQIKYMYLIKVIDSACLPPLEIIKAIIYNDSAHDAI